MHPWEQPIEVRIAAAQARLLQRVRDAREVAEPGRAAQAEAVPAPQ